MFPAVDLGARSEYVRLIGECYRSRIDPVRAGKVLASMRKFRECGEHF